jgi:hypothetical protein
MATAISVVEDWILAKLGQPFLILDDIAPTRIPISQQVSLLQLAISGWQFLAGNFWLTNLRLAQ